MRVDVLDFVTGARAATGIAVVIDVFRAFSTACYATAGGARVVPVADIDEALALGARHPDWFLAGELASARAEAFGRPSDLRHPYAVAQPADQC